jgi:ribose/xylose/arabinose/galactoside ABC-type transport system permease subunit
MSWVIRITVISSTGFTQNAVEAMPPQANSPGEPTIFACAGSSLLTVIAAIILGGTSLYGGRGSVWGTVLAVLILGTLNNGLTLLDVSSFCKEITRGVVLISAVAFDQIRTRAAV